LKTRDDGRVNFIGWLADRSFPFCRLPSIVRKKDVLKAQYRAAFVDIIDCAMPVPHSQIYL
jgi:hypothetical protein